MSWLDDMISFFSPRLGAKREEWSQYRQDLMRNYDAGNNNRANMNWNVFNDSAENIDRYYRDTVRARSRDLERNSDIMGAVLSAWQRNVIGGGYTLECKVEDKEIKQTIEDTWKKWCKKRNCDVTGDQSFQHMMRMIFERKKIDGGVLIKKCFTPDGIVRFKLQVLEVDELDIVRTEPRTKGNKVIGGIEIDQYNRNVGYWIRQYALDGYSLNDSVYVDAKDMIYYWSKHRPSQKREMSDMAKTVTRIRDVNEFVTTISIKERVAACLSAFIKKLTPEGKPGFGRPESYEKKTSYQNRSLSPGMILELNPGEEVQTVTPPGQSADATTHVKLLQGLVAAGQGLSYEAVSRDMSQTNYSSARQGAIEDSLTYQEEKELFVEVMDEIYETFVISCVLCGIIEIPDFWNNKEKYFEHTWTQQSKQWIDPLKESNANRIALMTGQKSFRQICAENGIDWHRQMEDMAEEYNFAKDLDLQIGGLYNETKQKTAH